MCYQTCSRFEPHVDEAGASFQEWNEWTVKATNSSKHIFSLPAALKGSVFRIIFSLGHFKASFDLKKEDCASNERRSINITLALAGKFDVIYKHYTTFISYALIENEQLNVKLL